MKNTNTRSRTFNHVTNAQQGACLLFDHRGTGLRQSRARRGDEVHPVVLLWRSLRTTLQQQAKKGAILDRAALYPIPETVTRVY